MGGSHDPAAMPSRQDGAHPLWNFKLKYTHPPLSIFGQFILTEEHKNNYERRQAESSGLPSVYMSDSSRYSVGIMGAKKAW